MTCDVHQNYTIATCLVCDCNELLRAKLDVQADAARLRVQLGNARDQIDCLRGWALSRIAECRRQEEKFCGAWEHREKHSLGPPQALVEAWTERRALQAALGMVGATQPESEGK